MSDDHFDMGTLALPVTVEVARVTAFVASHAVRANGRVYAARQIHPLPLAPRRFYRRRRSRSMRGK